MTLGNHSNGIGEPPTLAMCDRIEIIGSNPSVRLSRGLSKEVVDPIENETNPIFLVCSVWDAQTHRGIT